MFDEVLELLKDTLKGAFSRDTKQNFKIGRFNGRWYY